MTGFEIPEPPGHLSVGEVINALQAEFPDVTISKIRFLESQGLITPEVTSSGYRKFYKADVDRLRWVLRQQRDHFLPLKVIKAKLEAGEGVEAEQEQLPFDGRLGGTHDKDTGKFTQIVPAVGNAVTIAHDGRAQIDVDGVTIFVPPSRSDGAARIAAERQRQIEVEGWSAEHDDQHVEPPPTEHGYYSEGPLLAAARAYMHVGSRRAWVGRDDLSLAEFPRMPWWPWADADWKPSDDPRVNLIKAGALIAAEIDRLDRLEGGKDG